MANEDSRKHEDGLSMNTLMFQVITKNTEVLTELSKTHEAMQEAVKEISDGYIGEVLHREETQELMEEQDEKIQRNYKLLIAIMILVIALTITFALGGDPGWLLKLCAKFIPGI